MRTNDSIPKRKRMKREGGSHHDGVRSIAYDDHSRFTRWEAPFTPRVSEDDQRILRIPKAHGGCLGIGSRRRARQAAKSPGEAQTAFDPGVSRTGKPARGSCPAARPELIRAGDNPGTETSKYPEEEKSTEIAGVAASETARAQTHARVSVRALPHGGRGSLFNRGLHSPGGVTKDGRQRNGMEGPAAAGDSPVREAPSPRQVSAE